MCLLSLQHRSNPAAVLTTRHLTCFRFKLSKSVMCLDDLLASSFDSSTPPFEVRNVSVGAKLPDVLCASINDSVCRSVAVELELLG